MANDEYRAVTKFLFASPTKVRSVVHIVKQKICSEVVVILTNMPQKGARLILKTLKSAISNALNANKKIDEDMLYVKEIHIDDGPRLKRVWFRGRGRSDMLLKRLCHITVVVGEKNGEITWVRK